MFWFYCCPFIKSTTNKIFWRFGYGVQTIWSFCYIQTSRKFCLFSFMDLYAILFSSFFLFCTCVLDSKAGAATRRLRRAAELRSALGWRRLRLCTASQSRGEACATLTPVRSFAEQGRSPRYTNARATLTHLHQISGDFTSRLYYKFFEIQRSRPYG